MNQTPNEWTEKNEALPQRKMQCSTACDNSFTQTKTFPENTSKIQTRRRGRGTNRRTIHQ